MKVSASPSGSANQEDASTTAVSPTGSVSAAIVPAGSGARFGTVTWNARSTLAPSASLAATVTVATPGARARIVISASETATVATSVLDEVAV